MVDTREVFAGLYADGSQPLWKARLDEILPDPALRSRHQDDDADGSIAAALRPHNGAQTATPASSSSSSATPPSTSAPSSKRKPPARGTEDEEPIGPFYDEGADLKDELWVTEKYLRHQPRPDLPPDEEGGTAAAAAARRRKQQQQQERLKEQRPEDWTSDKHDPLTRPRRSDAVLSCPCCFTPLCYDCQRHEVYVSQYRAMFVTDECSARLTEFRTYDGDQYHPVFCSICETEVGVFEQSDELYHFFNVIPGN